MANRFSNFFSSNFFKLSSQKTFFMRPLTGAAADSSMPMSLASISGQTRMGLLMTVLIIGVLTWLGSQVIPFYYDETELQGLMDSQAKVAAELKDIKIRKNIETRMKKLGVPADPEDLKINRFSGKIVIELEYYEVLSMPWFDGKVKDLWVFHMNPRAERYYE